MAARSAASALVAAGPPTPSPRTNKGADSLNKAVQQVLAAVAKPASSQGTDAEVRYHSMCQTIDMLLRHEPHILYLHGVVSHSLLGLQPKQEDAWHKELKFVGSLDKG